MRRILLAGTTLLASALIGPAAHATVTPGTVTVAAARQTSDLQLLGASDRGFAAARDGDGVVVAPTGFATLLPFGGPYHPPADGSRVSDLTGNILRWAEPKGVAWVVHTRSAIGGDTSTDLDSPDRPVAFTPDGWIGFRAGTLTKRVVGGAATPLLTGLAGAPEVRADAKGAAVRYQVTVGGKSHTRLGLITFGRAGIDVIADHDDTVLSGELPTAIALTPNSVAWFAEAQPVNILGVVHRRARAGGAISAVNAPAAARAGEDLAATDTTIAVTRRQRSAFTGDSSVRLYALRGTGTTWQTIVLPGPDGVAGPPFSSTFGGLLATPDTIAFALGGDDLTISGVYTLDGDATPALAARVSPDGAISDVSLEAGRLAYATAGGWPLQYRVSRAAVSPGGALTVTTPATPVPGLTVSHSRTPGQTTALSLSGDRLAARAEDGTIANRVVDGRLFTDTGTFVAQVPQKPSAESPITNSGAYLLLNHKVYRGDSLTPVLDLTSRRCRDEGLFGSLVVCNQPDGQNVVLDAEGRFPTGTTTGTGTGEVAIWGTTVAWVADATTIKVQDLAVAGSLRSLPLDQLSAGVHDLRLGEGAVSWLNSAGDLLVADRSNLAGGYRPTGLRGPYAVDDHLAAGIAGSSLKVATLPFGTSVKYRPRLIDSSVPASFAPASATWKPVFDTTKPLTGVKVEVRRGNTLITTLTGTGAAGAVRDLAWNGKTVAGADAPAGAYSWTLLATARDGDGFLTNLDGTNAITGTVYVAR